MCSSCVGDQTGSGKTFTITGGASRYVDRGIIPRTLSYIFKYFQEVCVRVYVCMHACVRVWMCVLYVLFTPSVCAEPREDLLCACVILGDIQ